MVEFEKKKESYVKSPVAETVYFDRFQKHFTNQNWLHFSSKWTTIFGWILQVENNSLTLSLFDNVCSYLSLSLHLSLFLILSLYSFIRDKWWNHAYIFALTHAHKHALTIEYWMCKICAACINNMNTRVCICLCTYIYIYSYKIRMAHTHTLCTQSIRTNTHTHIKVDQKATHPRTYTGKLHTNTIHKCIIYICIYT